MMSNSWRDPVWRAAFLLLARPISTDGDCDMPTPPDGTRQGHAQPVRRCRDMRLDVRHRRPASSPCRAPARCWTRFCSRCHMPTNYVDNVPLRNVTLDAATGLEHAPRRPEVQPDLRQRHGPRLRDAGHRSSATPSRARPGSSAPSATATPPRATRRSTTTRRRPTVHARPRHGRRATRSCCRTPADSLAVADPASAQPRLRDRRRRLPPVAARHRAPRAHRPAAGRAARRPATTATPSAVFGQAVACSSSICRSTRAFTSALYVRAEMCAACHDVTNALTIKNPLGPLGGRLPHRAHLHRVAEQPLRRPARQHATSIPRFKRDCQSCHMQQDYGQPGTAQTLYRRRRARCRSRARPSPPTASRARRSRTTSSAATPSCPA